MLFLPDVQSRHFHPGLCVEATMQQHECISMRHLPSLTNLQPGLLQATMQHQEVLEAQATEFLQWSADSQSCHRAWQLQDWDPGEADDLEDSPAAQPGQLSDLPFYVGTPQPTERRNAPAPLLGRCVWQQPWHVMCCLQGSVRPTCICVSATLHLETVQSRQVEEALHAAGCVCHHSLWDPSIDPPPLQATSCLRCGMAHSGSAGQACSCFRACC